MESDRRPVYRYRIREIEVQFSAIGRERERVGIRALIRVPERAPSRKASTSV